MFIMFLFFADLTNLGTFNKLWFVGLLSVQTFQSLIVSYRRGNFVGDTYEETHEHNTYSVRPSVRYSDKMWYGFATKNNLNLPLAGELFFPLPRLSLLFSS